jgi:uncharacterized protein YcbK (DUF882 family)
MDKKWLLLLLPAATITAAIVVWRRNSFYEDNEVGSEDVADNKVDEQYAIREKNRQVTKHFNTKEFYSKLWASPDFSIDVRLFPKLEKLRTLVSERLGRDTPIIVNSAYRSRVHNKAKNGASNSMHLFGKAADTLVTKGLTVDEYAELVRKAGFTGIGRYYSKRFVHGDIGRKREWKEK